MGTPFLGIIRRASNPRTPFTLLFLGLGTLGIGQWSTVRAEPQPEESLPKPSADSVDHLQSEVRRNRLRELSHQQYSLQKFAESVTSARRAADLTREVKGDSSSELADDLRWVVRVLLELARYGEAEEIMQQIVAIRRSIAAGVPRELRAASEVIDAEVYLRYIRRYKELTKDEQSIVMEGARKCAEAERLEKLKREKDAIRLAEEGLMLRKQALRYQDKVYLDELGVHASRLLRGGQSERAKEVAEETVAGMRDLFGDQHRWYASALNLQAMVFDELGDAPVALARREMATPIYLAALGPEHKVARQSVEMLATAYRRAAIAKFNEGEFGNAAAIYKQEADCWQKIFGVGHWRVREANVRERVTVRYGKLTPQETEELSKAANWAEEAAKKLDERGYGAAEERAFAAYEILSRIPGDDSLEATNTFLLICEAQTGRKSEAAVASYRKRWEVLARSWGPEHPNTLRVVGRVLELLDERATSQRDNGQNADMVATLVESLELSTKGYGEKARQTVDIAQNLAHARILSRLTPEEHKELDKAQGLFDEAEAHRSAGKLDKAIASMQSALAIRSRLLKDSFRTANCLNALGQLYTAVGRSDEAAKYIRQTLELRKRLLGPQHPKYAETLHNWATLEYDLHNYGGARRDFLEALQILRSTLGEHDVNFANTANSLAMTYMAGFHNLAEAEPLLQQALSTAEQKDFPAISLRARILNNLASVYKNMGREQLADELFSQAAEIWKNTGETVDQARALDHRANLAIGRGEIDQARRLEAQALELFEQGLPPQHPDVVICQCNLATSLLLQGEREEALKLARSAAASASGNLRVAATLSSEEQELRLTTDARRTLDMVLSFTAGHAELDEESYERVLEWKGRVFLGQRLNRLASHNAENKSQLAEFQRITGKIAALSFRVPPAIDRDVWQAELKSLVTQREELERSFSAMPQSGLPISPADSLRRVKQSLGKDEVLVDLLGYVHLRPERPLFGAVRLKTEMRLAAFVVTSDGPVKRVDLGPTSPIVTALEEWRRVVSRRRSPQTGRQPAMVLREKLWEPLIPLLGESKTVLISPDGPIAKLPWGALPGRTPGSYLIEDHVLAVLPVAQWLNRSVPPGPVSARPSMLLVGDIDYGPGDGTEKPAAAQGHRAAWQFGRLPGTAAEIDGVANLYKQEFGAFPEILRGPGADESAVRKQAIDKRVLHLATHGFFAPQQIAGELVSMTEFSSDGENWIVPASSLSGLALAGANRSGAESPANADSDGVLTALEASHLDLEKAELVVLSACETGLGKDVGGEGLLGLQRAFQAAGTSATLTSLWSVDDRTTQEFMVEFYQNLWSKKMSKAEAVRQAQLTLLRRAAAPQTGQVAESSLEFLDDESPGEVGGRLPFYWAPFILSGDWR